MLRVTLNRPARVLMTVDAMGGVWRYALSLAHALEREGIACLLAGFGPQRDMAREPLGLTLGKLIWTDVPLDWMARDAAALRHTGATILALAKHWAADLLHLNLPSQAAALSWDLPVVVASHSCLPTWWDAVHGGALPQAWQWHRRINADGFDRADAVVTPSASHGAALQRAYGAIGGMRVVHNATVARTPADAREDFILAAGRWWDAGKNAAVLDQAAAGALWPVVMAGLTTGPTGTSMSLMHADGLGELPELELRGLMGRAGVFTAPSRYEPFGLAVLEAAAAGAALVLADIPTFRELWNGAAMFVPPCDPAAYAVAFNALAGSPGLRQRLSQRAQARAGEFTLERQTQATLAVYDAAMARRRAPVRQVA